jgi:GTP-binding protein LepA
MNRSTFTPPSQLRNFSIVAHIDHGKSTLADRLLEKTGAITAREARDQVLDSMDLERERGITIKSHPIRMTYAPPRGERYILNLIDTPGHVDFSYEVSRSLAAVDGALLVVDAAQGVEAQTVSNYFLASRAGLEIIPVINKIDLPNARVEVVARQLSELTGLLPEEMVHVSAKSGLGIDGLLEAMVARIPAPEGDADAPLQALIFDSVFDRYRGVVAYIRVMAGKIRPGMMIRLWSTGRDYEVTEVGHFRLGFVPGEVLGPGDVGYVMAGVKEVGEARVGDTVTEAARPASSPCPGFRQVKPMVFCGFYPADSEDLTLLREALEKLQLNDAALSFEPERSGALGFGFRCGFLGLLHMEIVQERLEREYGIRLVATSPGVRYRVIMPDGETVEVENPAEFPETQRGMEVQEPFVRAQIITPPEYVGAIMKLTRTHRGEPDHTEYLDPERVLMSYDIPLAEIIISFYDQLKSVSRGYASFDYELGDFRSGDLVKLDIVVAGEKVDALSGVVHRNQAETRGRAMVSALKELIPRQLFAVSLQAAVGSRILARETIPAVGKNVTAKCYGGDITRKRKLWEKQKEGKKRLRQVGQVRIPQEAFLALHKQGRGK